MPGAATAGETILGVSEAARPTPSRRNAAGEPPRAERTIATHRCATRAGSLAALIGGLGLGVPGVVGADEGGVSFWLPGNFGSFAATPAEPGLSLPLVYYHGSGSADAAKAFARGGRITAGVDARSDLAFAFPTFAFAFAGGQASVGAGLAFGRVDVAVDATLAAPGGGVVSGREDDSRTGVCDLYPTASLKWGMGVDNLMIYTMAGVPVGTYDVGRLANLGTNHWSIDGGGAYTYFDESIELSAALGATYSFENPATEYRNGVSGHLDWAGSWFVSRKIHAGVAGYVYGQLTGDSGDGARLGDFRSSVVGVGPQVGLFFEGAWYANLKGFYEPFAQNRPSGWNLWATLAIPVSN